MLSKLRTPWSEKSTIYTRCYGGAHFLILQANMCFCDLDTGTLELPEDFPAFAYRQALREEVELYLIQCSNSLNGHMRDSGFR